MSTVREICDLLEEWAPTRLAEEWDNVGLLVGDPARPVQRVMTCLTVTPESVHEAVDERADLIVSHHPLPFRTLREITSRTVPGKLLLRLIEARIAVASHHTAFDSASRGINQQLAEGLGLEHIQSLVISDAESNLLGTGRWGHFPEPRDVAAVARRLKGFLSIEHARCVGDPRRKVATAAVACGSAGQLLSDASAAGCELLVTGETNFHTCLEAIATGVCLLLPGHFASERFAVERLATMLQDRLDGLEIWPSRREHDPIQWI